MVMEKLSRGSEWRKWDLHVHTKGTMKNDQFTSTDFKTFCNIFFQRALENQIAAIGITDYFNIDNYKKILNFVDNIDSNETFKSEEREQIKDIFILPNIELRMLPVTDSGRLINIHCLFNPEYIESLENDFFGSIEYVADTGKKFKMNRKGLTDLGKDLAPKLGDMKAYKRGIDNFVVTHQTLSNLLEGNNKLRENIIIAVSNSNKDGASAFQKHYDLFEDNDPGSLDALRKSIYSISDCIFSSNEEDAKYFSGLKKDSKEDVINKCGSLKPCIHGSDAHDENKLFKPDENKYCWIKADTTFEGLKQIKYEPQSGERVKIGPLEPDVKDGYKYISKIQFTNTKDFPSELKINRNLCSIIGSRSSGKSALLAYIAHSVDKELTEDLVPGPGEGSEYHWDKISIGHSIIWGNGKSSEESPGKIVYIPQNHLFKESKNSNEIKQKIIPILFRYFPNFKIMYDQTINDIDAVNQNISNQIDEWFNIRNDIDSSNEELRNLGNENAINIEIKIIEKKIKSLKEKNELGDDEVKKYQELKASLSIKNDRVKIINEESLKLSNVLKENIFFTESKITLSPSIESLPLELQEEVRKILNDQKNIVLDRVNKKVLSYKENIEQEKKVTEDEISEINNRNVSLFEKYQKNIELEDQIKKLNSLKEKISKINKTNEEKNKNISKLSDCSSNIEKLVNSRNDLIVTLSGYLNEIDQSSLEMIKFGMEFDLDDYIEEITHKVNIKENSIYIDSGKLNINKIRNSTNNFLNAIYTGNQKINKGNEKKQVAKDILLLTEKILFNAEMEGDRIGGFNEPTMTPGKRALFLLRLILFESDDTWPLLIDQPEDDLDSRSTYDDIVPFLKEKKKERQIIMVSHNANLVIGSDSEQIIVANRNGTDRCNEDGKQFNYLAGSLEFSKLKDACCLDTLKSQGTCEHACEILDGGKIAFEKRKNKYNIK